MNTINTNNIITNTNTQNGRLVGFTTMLSWLKRYSTTWWNIWADLVGGVMLLAFAAFALLKLAQTLVRHGGIPTMPA